MKRPRLPRQKNKRSLFQRISLFFFRRPRKTALIWLIVAVFGAVSYTTLLKREGFPSIETPFAMSQGAYLVNDPAKVDKDVAAPLSEFLLKQSGVKAVQTQSFDNFYIATVSYNEEVNSQSRSTELQKEIENKKILPEQATGKLEAFKFGFTQRGDDVVVSFYSTSKQASTEDLTTAAKKAAADIKAQNIPLIQDVSVIDPYEVANNPATGQSQIQQKTFERFGKRENNQNNFYNAVVIGIKSQKDADQLELDKQIRESLNKINSDSKYAGYKAEVSGSTARDITAQINELQRTLLEGFLAVLIVGSIIIAIRASLITVLSMVSVIAIVNGLLYVLGYSLNTITLFGLVLSLSLIVDDTIIMVEAIDAQRRKRKNSDEVIEVATRKVGRAMIAATSTAALSFAPLLFVSGILGSFIKAIPITIISALVISLIVALVFIPLFARYLLLGEKQLGKGTADEPSASIEARIAEFIARPMLWAKNSQKKLFSVGIIALVIGFGFIGAGGYLFQKVTFNIFPSGKDTNVLATNILFQPNTDIQKAQQIADDANKIISDVTGKDFVKAAYYGQADIQKATMTLDLTDYKEREVKAPEIVQKLNDRFKNFDQAKAEAYQIDAGPPPAVFAARIESSQDRENASRLAQDIAKHLQSTELKRLDGSIAKIKNVIPPNTSIYNRDKNQQYIEVGATFIDTDTTTLVTLAQQSIEKAFPQDRVASYGLEKDALSFNFGQENENQDSFKTLALAFPILLLAIYVLLALQFKSLLQPLLIFMAIPFSLFGITLGLYLTDNAFSFFAMLGFFALIGLSIKNTILLTDYANQARNAGLGAVDAAHAALAERFRPLIATSLTAVFSLIPLGLTSPFWEGLAVVLIFGLLSSTFLVITVFPYYYLGSEYLRKKFSRKTIILWLIISAALLFALSSAKLGPVAGLAPIIAAVVLFVFKKTYSKNS